MLNHTILKRSLSIGLVLGASAFPGVAGARVIVPGDAGLGGPATHVVHTGSASAAPRSHAVTLAGPQAAHDFRWDDAGIGAAATVALLGAGGIATIGLRRRQAHTNALS